MKIIIALVGLLSFVPLMQAAPTMVQVKFLSQGNGIDQPLYEQIHSLMSIEQEFGNITSIIEVAPGEEGQLLCAGFSGLDHMQRVEKIASLLTRGSDGTTVTFAHHCP